MATTGFWPVKGQLKQVLDYADNPQKTASKPPVDDLLKTLRYTANDEKTEQRLFVSALNTSPSQAYADMMATKKRFGKTGGNMAYHGYQSFRSGEVTPEEAHQIGLETARRMWGRDYEVLIATHLNTDNLHNHFVINSVSFRNGKKFLNKKSDHIRLREISDEICAMRGKSVLRNASFYGGQRKAYWAGQAGRLTHREILRRDIEEALKTARNEPLLMAKLRQMGYEVDISRKHISVKAPSWQRPVRLDSLGFSQDYITDKLYDNLYDDKVYWDYRLDTDLEKMREMPLLIMLQRSERLRRDFSPVLSSYGSSTRIILSSAAVTATYLIMILLLLLTRGECSWMDSFLGTPIRFQEKRHTPVSAEMRQEMARLDRYSEQVRLLSSQQIRTDTELKQFITQRDGELKELEQRRYHLRKKDRRCQEPEKREEIRAEIKHISRQMAPIRKRKKLAEEILKRSAERMKLLQRELDAELERLPRVRQQERGRSR